MGKSFIRFSWITLVFILLVTLAGSVVRTTGSGMGCPDWPTCFDKIIPPTSADELPTGYQEKYIEYRKKKVEKFANVLSVFGFQEIATVLLNDPELVKEETFNPTKTWIEYVNRLCGFVAGNLVLITLIWVFFKYRQNKKLILLSLLNLILIGFEGWFGSIVVATNLVPWTITLHMLLALIIIIIQLKIISIAQQKSNLLTIDSGFKWLFYSSIALTFIQIILGSQVRQEVDFMVKDSMERSSWIASMSGDFLFHRSFSWVLLVVNISLFWLNRKFNYGIRAFNYILLILIVEFITGILFSYAEMPAFSQPVHFIMAVSLLVVQLHNLHYFKKHRHSLIS